MEKHLNTLREQKQRVVEELRNIRTKKLSKKWKVLYGIGYIGMIVLTTILLYPDNLFLAVLLTAGYGVSVPALSALIDSIKIKRLGKELNFIDTEIYTTKKEIQNQSLTKEERQKEILFTPLYKPLKVTEETRRNVLEHPELYRDLSVRTRMGNFYTDEEWEQRRDKVLNTSLPADNKKGYIRKKKR